MSTKQGWQTASLPDPVFIKAGQTYVASYTAPHGHYAADQNVFSGGQSIKSRALTAKGGVFDYGLQFPRQTYLYTNYYVDVMFGENSVSGPPTSTPPTPSSVIEQPTPNAPATSATSSTLRNCAVSPSRCGYPDASNSGTIRDVPRKSIPSDIKSGPGWVYDSRGWVAITGKNTVFADYDLNVNVDIQADGVTVRNVRISLAGESFGISIRRASNVTISNVEISAPTNDRRLLVGVKDIYGDAEGTVVEHSDISRVATGVQIYSGTIRENYIHDLVELPGDHNNGITSNGSVVELEILHNTILNDNAQTDAIGLFQDFELEASRRIDDNLLAGGGYTLYAGAGGIGITHDIIVTRNRFARLYFPRSGYWGPATAYDRHGTGNEWKGNIWDDTGSLVPEP